MSCPDCNGNLVSLGSDAAQCEDCGLIVTYLNKDKDKK